MMEEYLRVELQNAVDDMDVVYFANLLKNHEELEIEDAHELVLDILADIYSLQDTSDKILEMLRIVFAKKRFALSDHILIELFDPRHILIHHPPPTAHRKEYPAKHAHVCDILDILYENTCDTCLHIKNMQYRGATALLTASMNWSLDVVQTLVHMGSDIFAQDQYGRGIIFYAIQNKHYGREILEFLFSAETPSSYVMRDKFGRTPFMYAVDLQDILYLESRITDPIAQASIHDVDKNGMTPIIYVAARVGYATCRVIPMLNYFVEKGICINKTDTVSGRNALMYLLALYAPHRSVVECMVRHMIDLDAVDAAGNTTMMYAHTCDIRFCKTLGRSLLSLPITTYLKTFARKMQSKIVCKHMQETRKKLLLVMHKCPSLDMLPLDIVILIGEKGISHMRKHNEGIVEEAIRAANLHIASALTLMKEPIESS